MRTKLELTRAQVLAYRRTAGSLDRRMPGEPASFRRAARAGLQDSMPRAALLSIHARVEDASPTAWADPTFVQVWGPRFSAYVVAAEDAAIFTLGRLSDAELAKGRAFDVVERLEAAIGDRRASVNEAGQALGIHPTGLRYGTVTGRLRIRWDGARDTSVWLVPAPDLTQDEARATLLRRYLEVFGPGTAASFGEWAGLRSTSARAAFESLAGSLTSVRTPIGEAWILSETETAFLAPPHEPASARLLPSGDTFFLLQGPERELLVPDPAQRARLWTPRVWPGALLLDGEPAGTWRRAQGAITISPWRRLTGHERAAVEAEATGLPIPGLEGELRVTLPRGACRPCRPRGGRARRSSTGSPRPRR